MRLKKLCLSFLALAIILTASVADAGKIEDIEARGFIKIGTTMDYVPMSYRDQNGALKGFEIDLAQKIAGLLGWKIEFVLTSWPTLSKDTAAGHFDLAMSGITKNAARMKKFAMSRGYGLVGKTILCRKSEQKKYKGLADLNKPSVVVMVNPGGTNEKFAISQLPNCTRLTHQVNNEIPGLIGDGKADIMITEIVEARRAVKDDPRLAAPLINKPFTVGQWAVMMQQGDQDFLNLINYCLDQLALDGTLEKLCAQYGIF